MKVILLTALALTAFAANAVLCRLALDSGAIDPTSFTTIRLLSGAFVLALIFQFTKQSEGVSKPQGSWTSAINLTLYAITFSFGYLSVSSGTGALILFGAVQVTMLLAALKSGEKMKIHQWGGFAIAVAGLIYLVSPGVSAPDMKGAILMIISGITWAFYSLAGKSATTPIAMTAGNFLRAALLSLPIAIFFLDSQNYNQTGVILALTSGIITSGIAYIIWYRALALLSTTKAAILQLLVPPLASLGGVLFISEQFTTRLLIASILILGGVILSVLNGKASQS